LVIYNKSLFIIDDQHFWEFYGFFFKLQVTVLIHIIFKCVQHDENSKSVQNTLKAANISHNR
jgi:hypothetical protein